MSSHVKANYNYRYNYNYNYTYNYSYNYTYNYSYNYFNYNYSYYLLRGFGRGITWHRTCIGLKQGYHMAPHLHAVAETLGAP